MTQQVVKMRVRYCETNAGNIEELLQSIIEDGVDWNDVKISPSPGRVTFHVFWLVPEPEQPNSFLEKKP